MFSDCSGPRGKDSMIGFKYGLDEADTPTDTVPAEEVLQELFQSIMNPPDWQVSYEQTLFWALVFDTHDKIHRC